MNVDQNKRTSPKGLAYMLARIVLYRTLVGKNDIVQFMPQGITSTSLVLTVPTVFTYSFCNKENFFKNTGELFC